MKNNDIKAADKAVYDWFRWADDAKETLVTMDPDEKNLLKVQNKERLGANSEVRSNANREEVERLIALENKQLIDLAKKHNYKYIVFEHDDTIPDLHSISLYYDADFSNALRMDTVTSYTIKPINFYS